MARAIRLTSPDLVVLSLLAERPMHGYDLNQELLRRDVEDWAEVSQPQVYYSLRKLAGLRLIRLTQGGQSEGPERHTYAVTARGRRESSRALGRADWATQRPPPPFLTWAALCHGTDRSTRQAQVERRRGFLVQEIAREEDTVTAIKAEFEGVPSVPQWMVELTIAAFKLELGWLDELEGVLSGTSPSAHAAVDERERSTNDKGAQG